MNFKKLWCHFVSSRVVDQRWRIRAVHKCMSGLKKCLGPELVDPLRLLKYLALVVGLVLRIAVTGGKKARTFLGKRVPRDKRLQRPAIRLECRWNKDLQCFHWKLIGGHGYNE